MHPRDEAGVMSEATAAGTNPASALRPGETGGDAGGADAPARAELELRVGLAIDTLDLRCAELMQIVADHETWLAHLERIASEMHGEERLTQDRIAEAVAGRLSALRSKLAHLQHDQAALHRLGPAALSDPRRSSGDLHRLLKTYAPEGRAIAEADRQARPPTQGKPGAPTPAAPPVQLLVQSPPPSLLARLGGGVGVVKLAAQGFLLYVAVMLISPYLFREPAGPFVSASEARPLPQSFVGGGSWLDGLSVPPGARALADPMEILRRALGGAPP